MRGIIGEFILCAILLTGLAGCGGGDGGDDGATGGGTTTGNSALAGTWTRSSSPVLTLTFGNDGGYTGEFTGDGQADVQGMYATNGNVITLTDSAGPFACTGNGAFVAGTYSFAVSGSTLSLIDVADLCGGRVSILTGGTWNKK